MHENLLLESDKDYFGDLIVNGTIKLKWNLRQQIECVYKQRITAEPNNQ
jgi:hypothetical protein